ncbi:ankyrin repeat domain-containing protein 29 [Coprinopsis cinerea okayama7|uniref:Ankyrin repeat domain-containing protein 29 n=1 Tax=Coprinopsis cinerea (strain Okayama-7 / 130 / ATCC MYA-4618 / FGSC 9003) TaxID=240176 RepID=D6RQ03_COPC7|nr:ankyrin repeat domain-containing protein 29 [Coprinopsis cinerea okayama7\|eukprot:XP_002910417.1 ankyrin repeat domain-containing protein 29 [Coprinopsis cinerea okayama7\
MPGRIGIVFAYFRYTSNVSARDILEGLVKLHLQRDDTLVTLIKDTYTRHKAQRTRPSQGELLSILREIEKVYDITFYVLDGLDEVGSDTQFDLIEVIQLLHGNFVIMTRPLDILDAIPHAVLVNVTAQDRDIELLVSQKIDRNPRFRKLLENHGCRELVSRQVLVKSNGMFLHAALQLEALQQCSTIASVQETLDRFPAKLEEMYAVTVARIERQSPEYAALAKRVLTLLLCAQAPLTVAELRYVIATDSTMHRYEGSRVVDINTLVSVCCGLVHVGKNGIVQLVRARLTKRKCVDFTALDALKPIILQDPSMSHGWLAQVCMQRLVDCNITDWPMNHSLSRFEDALKQQRFLQYSYDHWATHAKEVGTDSSAFDAVLTFLRRCTSYPCPIDLTCGYDVLSHPQGQLEQLGSLQLASRYGLPATFGDVLVKQDESNLNTVTKPLGLTALMVAAWFDQGETVQWLLQQESLDINAPNASGQTALMLASAKGYEAIVKQLLQLPTVREDVNMQDVTGWTALMLASWFGYSSIVKLLLACEADGTVVTKNGTTALILASWKGHVSVVDQLLEHHPSTVDVNVRNEWGLTPLLVACWNGHVPVVERLLMYPGVQVGLEDVTGLTPLAHAKRCDHRSIVNRLLGHPGMTSNAQLAEEELMPGSEFSIDDQAMAIALDPRVPLIWYVPFAPRVIVY